MNTTNKKAVIGTVGGALIGAALGGRKALNLGMKIGVATAVTTAAVGSTIFVVGKKKIKNKFS